MVVMMMADGGDENQNGMDNFCTRDNFLQLPGFQFNLFDILLLFVLWGITSVHITSQPSQSGLIFYRSKSLFSFSIGSSFHVMIVLVQPVLLPNLKYH
jgi:hypothetical protein